MWLVSCNCLQGCTTPPQLSRTTCTANQIITVVAWSWLNPPTVYYMHSERIQWSQGRVCQHFQPARVASWGWRWHPQTPGGFPRHRLGCLAQLGWTWAERDPQWTDGQTRLAAKGKERKLTWHAPQSLRYSISWSTQNCYRIWFSRCGLVC